jgi:hypothetical protein
MAILLLPVVLLSRALKRGKKLPGEKLPALTPVPDGADFEQSSLACQEKLLPANHPVGSVGQL